MADLLANFRVRINPNTCIIIRRKLEGRGNITANIRDEVKPDDVLGRSLISGGFSSINIANRLAVSPKEAFRYLQRPIGSKIFGGELLAMKKQLFGKKVVTAPTDSLIDSYNDRSGELRLKYLPKEVPLTASVYGVVEQINKYTGEVLIKSIVTEVFGMLGAGHERSGILHLSGSASELVQPNQIIEKYKDFIVVVGGLIYGENLRKAVTIGVKGLIAGGINFSDFRSVGGKILTKSDRPSDVGITLLATEGLGPIKVGDDIYNLLKQFDGRFVFLSGTETKIVLPSLSQDSILSCRKYSFPDVSKVDHRPELRVDTIKMGSTVRIIWPPFMGYQGKVVAIDQTPTVLKSGASTFLITVATTFQRIKVPFPNVELI